MGLVIGVTGGIGTGKSTVLEMLGRLGAQTMSADLIARDVLAKGTTGYQEVIDRFGPSIVREDGEIDRPALGAIVFGDPESRAALERITHPQIIKLMADRISSFRELNPSPESVLAVEIPLLIECGLEGLVDQVLLVAAEQEAQVGRLTKRNGLTREAAEARIASQMPICDKLDHAQWVVWNDGTVDDLERRVLSLWQRLRITPQM